MAENRHEAIPAQLAFDFMYRDQNGYIQVEIDFAPSSRPLSVAEMLQKRDSFEKNVKKVKKSDKNG